MSDATLWRPSPPPKAGAYIVTGYGKVTTARYMPKKDRWVFPSAAMAFPVSHWMPLPEPPK